MSRIGKLPVAIPSSVTVTFEQNIIKVKGNKGTLEFTPHSRVRIEIKNGNIVAYRQSDEKLDKSLHGLTRTIIANMIKGVTDGFEKKLEIRGVGYRAQMEGKNLVLALGFSHPIKYTPPEGIHIDIDKEKKNILTITGTDKQVVGQVAAKIRSYRKPEPYKGKGIRYVGEFVPKKAGKAAAGAKE